MIEPFIFIEWILYKDSSSLYLDLLSSDEPLECGRGPRPRRHAVHVHRAAPLRVKLRHDRLGGGRLPVDPVVL